MKQIIAGWIRHLVSSGGSSLALKGYLAGDKLTAWIGGAMAVLAAAQSTIEKLKAEGGQEIAKSQSPIANQPALGIAKGQSTIANVAAVMIAAVLLVGCKSPVPATHITGNLGGKPFSMDFPKQFSAGALSLVHEEVFAGVTNRFTLNITNLSSTNDPQVIDKATAGRVAEIQALGSIASSIAEKVAQGAVQGAK